MRNGIINFGEFSFLRWTSFITQKRRARDNTSAATRPNQTEFNTYKSRSQTAYDWLCIERENEIDVVFFCRSFVWLFRRFLPSQRGGVMLGLFACLLASVNHTIYAFSSSIHSLLFWHLSGCVCARERARQWQPPNACVCVYAMIWFLYQ